MQRGPQLLPALQQQLQLTERSDGGHSFSLQANREPLRRVGKVLLVACALELAMRAVVHLGQHHR
jgi:hypothetical protein